MRIKILIILTITLILIGSYYYGIVIFAEEEDSVAKTLVTEKGTDISNALKYPDYVVISNNVNINELGVYEVVYRNVETGHEVTKNIHVIDDKKHAYFFEEQLYEESNDSGKYKIIDSFCVNDKTYTLFDYQSSLSIYNNYFLGYIQNDKHYSDSIILNSKTTLEDAYVYNDQIVFVGSTMNSMNGINELCVFRKDGLIYKNILIDDTESVISTSIAECEKYYIITGSTNITNDYFVQMRNGFDSFVMLLNKETNIVENVTMLPLKGDDEITSLEIYNNYLYLVQQNDTNNLRILKLDIFGNIVKEQLLELKYGYKNPKLKKYNNSLYLSYSSYEYETMDYVDKLYHLDSDLNLNSLIEEYNNGFELVDFCVNDGMYYLLYNQYKQKQGYKYQIYDANYKLLGEYDSNVNVKPVGLGKYNEVVATNYDNNALLYLRINSLLKLKEPILSIDSNLSQKENLERIESYEYYINGKLIKHSEKSKLEFNDKLYGNYLLEYHFDNEFEYFVQKTCEVKPFVGVSDGRTYDLGITLFGNGIVYVDNMLVELPYQINKTGEYEIKLTGKDNNTTIYNISVSNLSLDFEIDTKEKNIQVDKLEYSNVWEIAASQSFTENKKEQKKVNTTGFLYLIPLSVLGIGFILIKKV